MSGGPQDADDPATPAERRLVELLRPLREDPPRGTPGTALAVVTRARWQRPLRAALHSASRLVAAVGDAIDVALGHRRGGRRDGKDPEAQG
jgi:hypothetical protein